MKTRITNVALASGFALLLATGCITKDKVIDIVAGVETKVEQTHGPSTAISFSSEEIVDMTGELDNALNDAGVDKSDLKVAAFEQVSYGVTMNHAGDFTIGGEITVQRIDGVGGPAQTLIPLGSFTLSAALGQKIPANLDPAGIALLNTALDDYLNGGTPTLKFVLSQTSVTPTPGTGNPVNFDWAVWVKFHVVGSASVEVPDPF